METLIATAGLMTVAVLTPGPNNLIVLRESVQRGWRGALPASIGIVTGGLAILSAVVAGATTLPGDPRLTRLLGAGACLLLVALGGGMIRSSFRQDSFAPPDLEARRLSGIGGMFVFQFLNPKCWMLVAAVVSSTGSGNDPLAALPQFAVLFVVIPSACLCIWSLFGRMAQRFLVRRPVRAWTDRLTGGLLIGFAVLLTLGGSDVG